MRFNYYKLLKGLVAAATIFIAEPKFELGPAIQQASALPTELRCTLFILLFCLVKIC
jgi:hypothetical protein